MLVRQIVRHALDVRVFSNNPLSHLVQRRLYKCSEWVCVISEVRRHVTDLHARTLIDGEHLERNSARRGGNCITIPRSTLRLLRRKGEIEDLALAIGRGRDAERRELVRQVDRSREDAVVHLDERRVLIADERFKRRSRRLEHEKVLEA